MTENAAGATVKSAVPVEVSIAAEATLTLEDGAESSVIKKASSDVALKVENNTSATVSVTTEGSTTSEEIAANTTTGTTTDTSTSGSGNGTITTVTATVHEESSADGKTVTFTLPRTIPNLKSATVKVTTGTITKNYAISKTVLNKVVSLLNGEETYVKMWKGVTGLTVTSDNLTVKISGEEGLTKTVEFDGMKFTATVNEAEKSVTIVREGSNVSYTLSKEGNTKLIISSDSNANVADMVDFVVTY